MNDPIFFLALLYFAIGLTMSVVFLVATRIYLLFANSYAYDPAFSAFTATFILFAWPLLAPFGLFRGVLFLIDKAFPL
jgi:hypothetical protein